MHRQTRFLYRLQHADVREPVKRAAAERQADSRLRVRAARDR